MTRPRALHEWLRLLADCHHTSLWCAHEASPEPENSGEPRRIQESSKGQAKLRARRFGIRGEFPAIKFSAALLPFSRPNTRPKWRTIFPKELWAGSPVQIPSAPHLSLQGFGQHGESFIIRACAGDLRSYMDPENVCGGANRRNRAIPLPGRFFQVHR